MYKFRWVGSEKTFIDTPHLKRVGHLNLARFGGVSDAGQTQNEDGCFIICDQNQEWEFALLLDAHHTADSAEAVISLFRENEIELVKWLNFDLDMNYFKLIEEKILSLFTSQSFLSTCRNLHGETSCLIAIRRGKYLFWFSIGDCILFLMNPELAALGQFQVNQRQFYEWVGKVNTFEQEIPCYSSGTRELRKGGNQILLTTDGLVECPNKPFTEPYSIYCEMQKQDIPETIHSMLFTIKAHNVKDSTTMIAWEVTVTNEVSKPSE